MLSVILRSEVHDELFKEDKFPTFILVSAFV